MKNIIKIILISIIAFSYSLLKASELPWGIADTINDYQIGPGIRYLKINYPQHPLIMWVTEVDLTNSYNTIEQVQSNDKVPDVNRENVSAMSQRNSYAGHQVCAAFNHDFFSYDQGICIGLNINKGEITQRYSDGRSMLAITRDKTAHVFHPNFQSTILLPDNSSVNIDNYNWWALAHYGDCILFNRFNSITFSDPGLYIQFKAKTPWIVNGAPISCEVLAISNNPIQTTVSEYVLYARNGKENLFSGLKVGDDFLIEQKFLNSKFGIAPKDILTAFHGYPSIAYEGKLHEGEYNDFENGREYEKSSRLMAGMSKDGKKVYLYATELSAASMGIDCVELANFMLEHGCWNIVNFDSGGSVAVVIDHTMQNLPGRGSIRPVADGVLCVSTAPDDKLIDHYSFTNSKLVLPAASISPLQLMGYNQYGGLEEKNCDGFTFKCEPESLGYVDENQIFHGAFKKANGKIIAQKNGKKAEIEVVLQDVENISLKDQSILLDKVRQYPLHITGIASGIERVLDPAAFEWSNSNPNCCIIEDGVVKGMSNGTALLTGKLGNVILELMVSVEIGIKKMVAESFDAMNSFKITASSAFKNLSYSTTSLPSGWNGGVRIGFDLSAGRFPSLTLDKSIRLYGIPDSLVMEIELTEDLMNTFSIDFQNSKGELVQQYQANLNKGINHLIIPFTPDKNLIDIGHYPLSISRIFFSLKGIARNQQAILLSSITAFYPEENVTSISKNKNSNLSIRLAQNTHELCLSGKVEKLSTIHYKLYGMNGNIEYQHTQLANNELFTHIIPLALIPKGFYLLEVIVDNERKIFKIRH